MIRFLASVTIMARAVLDPLHPQFEPELAAAEHET